jgi:hypothetical protein
VIAVLLAVLFVGLLLVNRGREDAMPTAPGPTVGVAPDGPRIVSADELLAVPAQVGHEVYWAGEQPQRALELTILADGAVYVRYLSEGAQAGTDEAAFLTVASYPRVDAHTLVTQGGERPGAVLVKDQGGALVTAESPESTNAYFAFEDLPLLVEVFDPEPGRAFDLIQSGQIRMIQ